MSEFDVPIDRELTTKLGMFDVIGIEIRGLSITSASLEVGAFIGEVEENVRSVQNLDEVKNDPIFRAYRDFFWRAGIDPTKTRPAAEALTRRVLRGRSLPRINTLVDALNGVSLQTKIPFAAFDADLVHGPLALRFATAGETILPIGHVERLVLGGSEIVISDGEKVIALYPHRDSDETKITEKTRAVIILACGVPGVERTYLRQALERCRRYIVRFCNTSSAGT
ncbi:MAG: B3/B4 domain-containing protein [Candidatus Thorarchaeota archaeon]